jgi:hypothetical protein
VRAFLAVILVLVPLAAGCGSESPAGPAGAEVAPASAELFLSIVTDFDSEEWRQAADVAARFPDADGALAFLLEDAGLADLDVQEDLEPALGPETDIVAFDLAGEGQAVGLTQPDDPAKLENVLAELDEGFISRQIGEWTAFSDSEAALDRFEADREEGTLADSEAYQDAIADVDQGGILRLYFNGEGLEGQFPGGSAPTMALSVSADEGGVRLEGAASLGDNEDLVPENFSAELPESIPAGVLVYLGASDLEGWLSALRDSLAEAMPEFDRDLARVEAEIGVSLEEDVFPLFSGESALYVRAGLFIPEVTLLTEVDDEAAAMATLDRIVDAVGQYEPRARGTRDVEIDGVTARQVPIAPPIALYYAAFDGRLVVTTAQSGITALLEDGDRLADDEDFQEALDQAEVPEETSGLAYVNLEELIPYVIGFGEQAGENVPPIVRENLEPLQRVVSYAEEDGSTLHFAAFLAVD